MSALRPAIRLPDRLLRVESGRTDAAHERRLHTQLRPLSAQSGRTAALDQRQPSRVDRPRSASTYGTNGSCDPRSASAATWCTLPVMRSTRCCRQTSLTASSALPNTAKQSREKC